MKGSRQATSSAGAEIRVHNRKRMPSSKNFAAFGPVNRKLSRLLNLLCLLIFGFFFCPLHAQDDSCRKAEALIRNHQWKQASSILSEVLHREPRNLRALNLSGLALIGLGDGSGANVYFKRAIAIDPRFAPALKNLSINEIDSQNYAAAELHLEAAEAVTPQDQAIHLYLGEIFYRKQGYVRAADEFSKVDQLALREPVAAVHQAISYLHTREQARAGAFSALIPIDRLQAPVQFEMAIALEDAELPAPAVPFIQAVHAQYPDNYDIAVDRMIILSDAKDFPE